MAQFTPGPWAHFRDAYGDGLFVDTALGNPSSNVTVIAGNIFGEQREANAHLIAAAPELYVGGVACADALDNLLRSWVVGEELTDDDAKQATAALMAFNRALAKARGES